MPQKNSSRFSLRSVFISSWIIAMTLNFAAASCAEEPVWREMIWTGDVVQLKELEQMCLEYGILSEDVFWANGHADTPPSGGEVLLIPKSKSAIVPVWMETQSRKNGRVEPLVTVKPHGVPLNMRAAKESPDLAPQDRPLIESSALTSRVRPLLDRPALSSDSSPALPARPLPPSPSSSSHLFFFIIFIGLASSGRVAGKNSGIERNAEEHTHSGLWGRSARPFGRRFRPAPRRIDRPRPAAGTAARHDRPDDRSPLRRSGENDVAGER